MNPLSQQPTLRASDRLRFLTYALTAVVLGALGFVLAERQAQLRGSSINFVVSDGRGYYAYLPAIVIDQTLDLSNQYTNHWGDEYDPALLSRRTERGFPVDKYPIGLALTLSPAFLVAHSIASVVWPHTHSAAFLPDGYSPAYQVAIYALVLLLGLATMLLIDRVMIDHFGCTAGATLAAVLTFWLGSQYTWYYFREPIMVHAVSTFWVTLTVVLCLKVIRDAHAGRLNRALPPAMVFAMCMAAVCRPTNLFLLPLLAMTGWALTRNRRTQRPHAGRRLVIDALGRTPWALGLAPMFIQLWVWHAMSGHWLYYSYGDEGFHWAHPQLWATLFSTRHGLFVWSPLLLLCPIGIAWRWRFLHQLQRQIIFVLLLCAGSLWYLNSAWHCWWFGWAFGGRAFLELALLFTLGLACLFEQARTVRVNVRRGLVYGAAIAILYSFALMSLYATRQIPTDGYWF